MASDLAFSIDRTRSWHLCKGLGRRIFRHPSQGIGHRAWSLYSLRPRYLLRRRFLRRQPFRRRSRSNREQRCLSWRMIDWRAAYITPTTLGLRWGATGIHGDIQVYIHSLWDGERIEDFVWWYVYTKVETLFLAAFVTIMDCLPAWAHFKELIVHRPNQSHSSLVLIAETFLIRSLAKNSSNDASI